MKLLHLVVQLFEAYKYWKGLEFEAFLWKLFKQRLSVPLSLDRINQKYHMFNYSTSTASCLKCKYANSCYVATILSIQNMSAFSFSWLWWIKVNGFRAFIQRLVRKNRSSPAFLLHLNCNLGSLNCSVLANSVLNSYIYFSMGY